VCDTVCPEADPPSPNVHDHEVALLDPLPLNEQLNPVQLNVKLATEEVCGGGDDIYESL
jgi:hypothetical protein